MHCSSYTLLRQRLRLLTLDLPSFLIHIFNVLISFQGLFLLYPTHFDKLYFHLHLIQNIFISLETSSFTHVLFRSMLFIYLKLYDYKIIQEFGNCQLFFCYWFLVLYHWDLKADIVQFLFISDLLRYVLQLRMWYILRNVPRELEENVHSVVE